MPATTRPSLSSIVVKIRNYWFFSIVPKVLNFQCHKLLFLGGYIPPESSTKLYDISGRNYNVHVQVIGQIHHFYLSMIDPTPVHRCEPVTKIDANQSQKSLRTPLRRNGVHQPCIVTSALLANFPWGSAGDLIVSQAESLVTRVAKSVTSQQGSSP